jgi:hypothetical protein
MSKIDYLFYCLEVCLLPSIKFCCNVLNTFCNKLALLIDFDSMKTDYSVNL